MPNPELYTSYDDFQAADLIERRAAYQGIDAAAAVRFIGTCEPCQWQGRPRVNNLAALLDFDRHAATALHVIAITQAPDLGDEPVEDALHCDFCNVVESAADLTPDWNGETGNHLSCERGNGDDD